MAQTVRSAGLPAEPEQLWDVIANAHQLPRWWPRAIRVEAVGPARFTLVVATRRGKPVRLDQRVLESVAPERRSWTLELPGTPFQRLLSEWTTMVTLAPDGEGRTRVTICERQRLRGSFRLGLPLQVRPARRRLDQALANLAELIVRP